MTFEIALRYSEHLFISTEIFVIILLDNAALTITCLLLAVTMMHVCFINTKVELASDRQNQEETTACMCVCFVFCFFFFSLAVHIGPRDRETGHSPLNSYSFILVISVF